MSKAHNLASPGQRVVRMTCCEGARFVKESAARVWECARCHQGGTVGGLYEFNQDMELVLLSSKEAESYL